MSVYLATVGQDPVPAFLGFLAVKRRNPSEHIRKVLLFLENPEIEVHHRGCDCKGSGCSECATERDPDEKYEQQNDK